MPKKGETEARTSTVQWTLSIEIKGLCLGLELPCWSSFGAKVGGRPCIMHVGEH